MTIIKDRVCAGETAAKRKSDESLLVWRAVNAHFNILFSGKIPVFVLWRRPGGPQLAGLCLSGNFLPGAVLHVYGLQNIQKVLQELLHGVLRVDFTLRTVQLRLWTDGETPPQKQRYNILMILLKSPGLTAERWFPACCSAWWECVSTRAPEPSPL